MINIGRRFERLVVTSRATKSRDGRQRQWCRCDCGKRKRLRPSEILKAKSCGCLKNEKSAERLRVFAFRHGEALRTPEYRAWANMHDRCLNPKHKSFHRYGGRGITIHPALQSYPDFLAVVGRRPSAAHSLDRIDNDKNYAPGNVRWATPVEQATNRRTTHLITWRGETLSVSAWARKLGIARKTVRQRLGKGELPEEQSADDLLG